MADPQAEVTRWRATSHQIDRLGLRLTGEWQGLGFGLPGWGSSDLALQPLPATGDWPALVALARLAGHVPSTAGDLMEWLAGLSPEWWASAAAAAAQRYGLIAARDEATRELARIGAADGVQGSGELAAIGAQLTALRSAMPGIDETTPRAQVIVMQRQHQADRDELATISARSSSATVELARLAAEQDRLAAEAASLRVALAPLLSEVPAGDLDAAGRRLGAAAAAGAAVAVARQNLQGVLRGQGVTSVDTLRERLIQRTSELGVVAAAWASLIAAHPSLPQPAAADDLAAVEAQGAGLTRQRQGSEQRLEAVSERLRELEREAARLEGAGGAVNLAQAESRLAELRAEEQELTLEAAAIARAHIELRAAVKEYQDAHRNQLAEAAGGHFDYLSAQRDRKVLLDDGFQVSVALRGGRAVRPGQLSQGAQDQLYVALRIAIADLVAGRVSLPLLFDDPFLTFDLERLLRMGETFSRLASSGRQVWLLTHRPEFGTWGKQVAIEPLADWPSWEAE
jgi:DNA repair exonuclease SbcCD ATPase subunit